MENELEFEDIRKLSADLISRLPCSETMPMLINKFQVRIFKEQYSHYHLNTELYEGKYISNIEDLSICYMQYYYGTW